MFVSLRGGDDANPNEPASPDQVSDVPEESIDPTLDLARQLSRDMAEPWPDIQKDNGHFRSGVGGGTRYGDALMSYALLQQGLVDDNQALIDSGIKGLTFAVPRLGIHSRPSIFEALGIAGAYNLGKRDKRVGDNPTFKKHVPKMESYLREFTLVRLPATTYYGNHWLIEAVMVQEMLRTGLKSDDKDAVVGGLREDATKLSLDLINKRIPQMAKQKGVRVGDERAFVLSDPPDDPLAYQGLSYGFYARGIALLGDDASPAAKRTLREIGNASLWLTAPDGDLAYSGRNQEQAWALGATAYGAEVTAGLQDDDPEAEARFRALAQRSLTRLRDAYGVGRFGLNITPGVKAGRKNGAKGLDGGAGGPSFGGLTLMFTDWTLPEIGDAHVKPSRIRSDEEGGALLSRGESRFAVVRRPDHWYSVRVTTSGKHPEELRNDFGLTALKQQTPDGWQDVLRLRPITRGDGDPADSAGPILLQPNGQKAFPFGDQVKLSKNGTVQLTGGYRGVPSPFKREVARLDSGIVVRALDFKPGVLVRSGVNYEYRPTKCGVRLTLPAQAGDDIEYSLFLTNIDDDEAPKITATSVTDKLSKTSFNRPAEAKVEPGYASGLDPKLLRVRLTFRDLPAGPLRITHCGQ